MKLVIISDSHGRHEELGTLRGDVLLHCGDSGNGFTRHADDVDRLDAWFGQQGFDRILCIGGNHDFEMQARAERGDPVFRNPEYLQDRAYEYRGVRFYGSPWTPELVDWAYYLDDDELRDRWELIPDEVEVLITHTRPSASSIATPQAATVVAGSCSVVCWTCILAFTASATSTRAPAPRP